MSVYSGFATRHQETTYNKFVFKTLEIISEEILRIKKNGIIPGKLNKYISSINYLLRIFSFIKSIRSWKH